MARRYRMNKRAEERDATRERILKATMAVHDEKGVAPATYADIAERAGVGQATVSRHFPRIGDLVRACGMHVWQEMQPPTPDTAPGVFAGLTTLPERVKRLVAELDAFYTRGELRLRLASRDRELVPELHGFLSAVEGGVEALVREALHGTKVSDETLRVTIALLSFPSWQAFTLSGLSAGQVRDRRIALVLGQLATDKGETKRKTGAAKATPVR